MAQSTYGSDAKPWHPEFVKFIEEMAAHPTYAGMPDAVDENGKVQWESPSNRRGGKYQHTHAKRSEWWKKKAKSIGVSSNESEWISRVAKRIHPFERKPCRNCGMWLYRDYRYLQKLTVREFSSRFPDLEFSRTTSIFDAVNLIHRNYGDSGVKFVADFLSIKSISIPRGARGSVEDFMTFLEDVYVPADTAIKSKLGPGAMCNPPDRFDGYHHYNRCCRGTADPGRRRENLSTYSTDRRVFQHWCGGDWIAADRLMGQFSTVFKDHECRIGGCSESGTSPDHIGPVSLGFAHRPKFALMCGSHNSSKNNRMTLFDVEMLRKEIEEGSEVLSWQSLHIWNKLSELVVDEETALRLSKIMRDNQRIAMDMLCQLRNRGCLAYLTTFLELDCARWDVRFLNISAKDGVSTFDEVEFKPRTSKQAEKQIERRMRVAFESLEDYSKKSNRHTWNIRNIWKERIEAMCKVLNQGETTRTAEVDRRLEYALANKKRMSASLLNDIDRIECYPPRSFVEATEILESALESISDRLQGEWNSDRYVRTGMDED